MGAFGFVNLRPAEAALYEKVVGLEGGLVLPSVEPLSDGAFASAGWRTGGYFSYGVTETLDLLVGFDVGRISGRAEDGRFSNAPLRLKAMLYRPYLGIRWVFWSGADIEPYVSGAVGFEWLAATETLWVTGDGVTRAEDEDFGEGRASLSAGVGVRWRMLDVFFVALEARYQVAVNSGIARHAAVVPVSVGWKFDL